MSMAIAARIKMAKARMAGMARMARMARTRRTSVRLIWIGKRMRKSTAYGKRRTGLRMTKSSMSLLTPRFSTLTSLSEEANVLI